MIYTISDLQAGRVAVVNDGTVEQLNAVLQAAWPGCVDAMGTSKYYYKWGSGRWIDSTKIPTLPTQSVFLFSLREEPQERVYRCGWCGECCDKDGNNIELPDDKSGYDEAEKVQGKCCMHELWDEAFTNVPIKVAQRTEEWLKQHYNISKK